jgi:hypothetical protein
MIGYSKWMPALPKMRIGAHGALPGVMVGFLLLSGCERATRNYPPAFELPTRSMGATGYSVEWDGHYFPDRVKRGSKTIASLSFKNTSDQVWPTFVRLGYSWVPASGSASRIYPANRILFRRPVAPGSEVLLDRLEVVAPDRPGRYRLTFDLVHEFHAWFSDRGAAPLTLSVQVE